MKLKLNLLTLGSALTLSLLGACKGSTSAPTSALQGDGEGKAKKSVFNLADYLQDSPYSPELKPFLKDGDVVFGDLKKIGIRTNVKVETSGKTKLTPNGSRNLSGQYFLNAAVYPDGFKIGKTHFEPGQVILPNGDKITTGAKNITNNKEYEIVDIQSKAGFDVQGVEGHVRMFGNDIYAFNKKAIYEQSFTRELSMTYPLMLGMEAKATIGGEIGFKAEAVVREDDAISLRFQPKIAVNTSVSPRFSAFKLITAGVKGILTLVETSVATSASVGYLPDEDFSYGDISMDAAEIKALDGKVKVVATLGLKDILTGGLLGSIFGDSLNTLWKTLSGKDAGLEWEHVVWDPKPLYTAKIPARGVFFTSEMRGFDSKECASIRNQIYVAGDIMEKIKKDAKGLDADIAMTAQANLAKTALSINSTCGK